MARDVFPPRITPLKDAGIPDEAGNYPDTAPLDVHDSRTVKIEDPIVRSVSEPDARVPRRDPVEHPGHYEAGPCQAHDARAWIHDRLAEHDPRLARAAYEALKYWWRCGAKGDPQEDIAKSLWYLREYLRGE